MAADAVVTALDTAQAKNLAVAIIVGLLLVAVILNVIITRLFGRMVILVVALAAAGLVWMQRSAIENASRKCDVTFFGVHLTPADPSVKRRCQDLTS